MVHCRINQSIIQNNFYSAVGLDGIGSAQMAETVVVYSALHYSSRVTMRSFAAVTVHVLIAHRKVVCLFTVVLLGIVVVLSKYWRYSTNIDVKISPLAPATTAWSNMTAETVEPVVTEATAYVPAVITVTAAGNFFERVHQFTVQLDDIRRRTWQSRGVGERNYQVHCGPVKVLWGARDDSGRAGCQVPTRYYSDSTVDINRRACVELSEGHGECTTADILRVDSRRHIVYVDRDAWCHQDEL